MEEIKLVLAYPKTYPIGIGDEQRKSFDINDANQVKEFIRAALIKFNADDKLRPHLGEPETDGMLIELLLEDAHQHVIDFENNSSSYRELVLKYVMANFPDQKDRHRRRVDEINSGALKKLGMPF